MTYEQFMLAVTANREPDGLSAHLRALFQDARGNWTKAHEWVQNLSDKDAGWIHGYLHRREGDDGNAAYWYARSGKPFPNCSLDEERENIIRDLLERE